MDVVHLISPRTPTPVQGIPNGGVKEGALRKTAWKRGRVCSTTDVPSNMCRCWQKLVRRISDSPGTMQVCCPIHFWGDKPNEEAISTKCCPVEFVMNAIGTAG